MSNKEKITVKKNNMIWANLLHLSHNMWVDFEHDDPSLDTFTYYSPKLRFNEELWNEIIDKMAKVGMNMLVIDLGDAVRYQSHPEIAVKNAWSIKKLKAELARLRKLGIEPIPKLNFSAGHDAWLGEYGRMVSTDAYYAVCKDLIAEVCGIFDKPKLFHLGMDEEVFMRRSKHVVIRQFDLWWHDLYFFVKHVEKGGSRGWVWFDRILNNPESEPELFYKNIPKSVVQSNYYYAPKTREVLDASSEGKFYISLEKHGYDQIPTGSNIGNPVNFGLTVDFCREHIDPSRLLGFCMAPWRPTLEIYRNFHLEAIDQVAEAMAKFNS